MSRSYKKQPIDKCGSNYKFGKKLANKRVRKTFGISNGKAFKRVFCSWNICDCRYLYTNSPNRNKFSRELMEEFKQLPRYFWDPKFENIWREKARRK